MAKECGIILPGVLGLKGVREAPIVIRPFLRCRCHHRNYEECVYRWADVRKDVRSEPVMLLVFTNVEPLVHGFADLLGLFFFCAVISASGLRFFWPRNLHRRYCM